MDREEYRVFLVGAQPGKQRKHNPEYHALFPHPANCTGHKLWKMTGLSRGDYVKITRRNVVALWPGDGFFPVDIARKGAAVLRPLLAGHHVVFMGRVVATVFGHYKPELLTWRTLGGETGYTWVVLPHPSGRNRWYNDATNRGAAELLMRQVGDAHRAWLDAHGRLKE